MRKPSQIADSLDGSVSTLNGYVSRLRAISTKLVGQAAPPGPEAAPSTTLGLVATPPGVIGLLDSRADAIYLGLCRLSEELTWLESVVEVNLDDAPRPARA